MNRNGEVILRNDDDEAAKTLRIRFMDPTYVKVPNSNNNLYLISKENRGKVGPIVAFDIYRDGTWLKACDLHLPTEIIKTFREQFRKDEIEVLYIDGDNTNCSLDNLVAKIIVNDRMKHSPCDVLPPSHQWTKAKLWNGEVLPNYYCSIDGNIALIRGNTIQPRKTGSAANSYVLLIQGMRFDARKLIWRAFTDQNPQYSECHYNVHIISKTRGDLLAFSNLAVYIESSIFDKWTKEEVTWP